MPTVPVYGDFKVQQGNTPTPTLLAPDMPNVAAEQTQKLGEAIGNVGAQLSKIEQDAMVELNDARVTSKQNDIRKQIIALKYGDGAAEPGFTNILGEDALGEKDRENLVTKYSKTFKQKVDEAMSGLGNDMQKTMFAKWAEVEGIEFDGSLIQHVGKETKNFAIKQNDSAIELLKNEVGQLDSSDPSTWETIEKNKTLIEQHVKKGLSLSGLGNDDAIVQKNVTEQLSEVNIGIIRQAINNENPESAETFLDDAIENKQMTDDHVTQARAWIADSKFTVQAQNETSRLLLEFNGNPVQAEKNIPDHIKGKLRDNISQRLRQENQRQQALREQSQKAYNDKAFNHINTGGSVYDLSPEIKEGMAPEVLYSLTQQVKKGPPPRSNPELHKTLTSYIANDPERFKSTDLESLRHRLSPQDYKSFSEKQTKMKKGEGEGKNVVTVTKLISQAAVGLEGVRAGDFGMIAAERIEEEEVINGRPLTVKEINAVLMDLRIKGEIESGKFYIPDKNVERFEAIKAGKAGSFVKD